MTHTGWTPRHVSTLSTLSEPVCSLRSSGGALLLVLKSRMRSKGDWVIEVRVSWLRNGPLEQLKLAGTVNSFVSLLESHSYRQAFMRSCTDSLFCHPLNRL